MADIRRIVDLYELRDSYKEVARELNISKNTVKKYVHRVKDVQDGATDEILPKNRKIIQPSRVLTDTVRQKICQYLESNLGHPRENSDSLPNESGSFSLEMATKSVTLASKTK